MTSVIASISVILSFYDTGQGFLASPATPQPPPAEQSILVLPQGWGGMHIQGQGCGGLEICLPPNRHVACALGSQSFGGWGPCRHPHFSAAFLFL